MHYNIHPSAKRTINVESIFLICGMGFITAIRVSNADVTYAKNFYVVIRHRIMWSINVFII